MKQKFKKLDLNHCLNFCKKAIFLQTILTELVNLSEENKRSRSSKYELLKRAEGQKAIYV